MYGSLVVCSPGCSARSSISSPFILSSVWPVCSAWPALIYILLICSRCSAWLAWHPSLHSFPSGCSNWSEFSGPIIVLVKIWPSILLVWISTYLATALCIVRGCLMGWVLLERLELEQTLFSSTRLQCSARQLPSMPISPQMR